MNPKTPYMKGGFDPEGRVRDDKRRYLNGEWMIFLLFELGKENLTNYPMKLPSSLHGSRVIKDIKSAGSISNIIKKKT